MPTLTTELSYWKAVLAGIAEPKVEIFAFVPKTRQTPQRTLEAVSAWKGIESILADIIERFEVKRGRCLEFGVEYGYSTAALSCYFDSVIGVDTFLGDVHTRNSRDLYVDTASRLSHFDNIRLIRSDYRDWIAKDDSVYDLIHVDIIHTYADTFACGQWSATHSKCVLFHDTESFPAVKQAVIDIARKTDRKFYNFKESNGLGILV
jgi:Methyltransferase domain